MTGVKSSTDRCLTGAEKETLEILRDEFTEARGRQHLELFLKGVDKKRIIYLPPVPPSLPGQFESRESTVEFLKTTEHIQWSASIAPNNKRLCPSHADQNERKLTTGQIILVCDLQR